MANLVSTGINVRHETGQLCQRFASCVFTPKNYYRCSEMSALPRKIDHHPTALRLKTTGKRRFYLDKKSHWLPTAVINQCDKKFAPFAASSGRLFSDSPFDALELKPSSKDVCSDESARGAYLHQPWQVERVMKVRLSCSAVEACSLFRLASLRVYFIEKVKT